MTELPTVSSFTPSQAEGDESTSPSLVQDLRPARCSLANMRRRWKSLLLITVLCIALVVAACYTLPTYIVQNRLDVANITLEHAGLVINADTAKVFRPSVHIRAPKSLLHLPFISFSATVHPFKAHILMKMTPLLDPVSDKELLEIGVMDVDKEVRFKSGADVNMIVSGWFELTEPEYLGQVVNDFVILPTMSATMQATMDVSALVWGWFPVYFPQVSVHYTAEINAFNNFKGNSPQLDQMNWAYGQPGELSVGCSAFIDNPAPMSMTVNDQVQLNVAYRYNGKSYIVGTLTASNLTVGPGRNVVNGTLAIQQTAENSDALIGLVTAYMGGMQTGTLPAGTKPFRVSILGDSESKTASPLLREAMKGMNLQIDFRPQPLYLIQGITADTTIGGSILHWPPSLYKVSIHVKMQNPLPQQARALEADITAYHMNLSGPPLYYFKRKLDPDDYIVKPFQDTILTFDLFLSEVAIPRSLAEIKKLANEAAQKKVTVGVHAKLKVIVDPGYEQVVDYKNNEISGVICYHVVEPQKMCDFDVPQTSKLTKRPLLTRTVV